jgi:hypothetical protein
MGASGGDLERRKYRRFNLCVNVRFKWKDRKGIHYLGSGTTRDIGTGGIFVYSDSLPPERTEVRMELFMGPSPLEGTGPKMTTRARVLRLEPAKEDRAGGFAVASRSFRIQRKKSRIP